MAAAEPVAAAAVMTPAAAVQRLAKHFRMFSSNNNSIVLH